MASHSGSGRGALRRRSGVLALLLCAAAPGPNEAAPQAPADAARRLNERLRALEREAADLETREQTLLAGLRKLEIEREMKVEELAAAEQELRTARDQIAEATARAARLRDVAAASRPGVEERLVRLYKMGRAGYWRLLLDVDDVRAMGRAYRTAAALTRIDRDSVRQHQATLQALERERVALEARARDAAALQQRAAAARAALDRAVAARASMMKGIDARQDLTAQLTQELRAAQQRLESAVSGGAQPPAALPLRPFQGALPWPAEGFVVGRFGRQRSVTGGEFLRNGIEISVGEGRPVTAVHEGLVTYAAPFTGYGQLVIVDHGGGAHSLYGHLATTIVNKGDRVEPGSRIGISGRNPAGNPAVYFELRVDGKPTDPIQWLRKQP